MKQIKFKLNEKPIGLNNAYPTNRQGRRYLTDEGKAYKARIGWAAKQAMQNQPFFEKPTVTIGLGFNRHGCDIDNPVKLILDAMTKIVYTNDPKVIELHVYKFYDKNNPFITVTVTEND